MYSMKVAHKLTVALVAGIVIILAAKTYITAQRQAGHWRQQNREDLRETAELLSAAAAKLWRLEGGENVPEIVEEADQRIIDGEVRWVWLEGDGDPAHQPRIPAVLLVSRLRTEPIIQFSDPHRYHGEIYTYAAVTTPSGRLGAIELSRGTERLEESLDALVWSDVVLTILVTITVALLALGLGHRFIGGPMAKLVTFARRVGEGDFGARVNLPQRDEIGDFGRELDAMAARLGTAEHERETVLDQLRYTDRLSTVGQIASSIAHELGTPLNVVSGRASMMASGLIKPDDVPQSSRIIIEQTKRMAGIIRQLLDFARRDTGKIIDVDISDLVSRVLQLLKPTGRKRGVTFSFDDESAGRTVPGDPGKLQQVFANLIVNGIHAMPDGGRLALGLRFLRATAPPDYGNQSGDFACISIRDEGYGISKADREQIFEPFFTTKRASDGTGLGLPVSDGLVREHGGWIEVESQEGRGSCFRVYLPARASE